MTKVSVLMLTYNHEKYIKEAIESVLMQKTNFEYELVIGEDYSTDNTRNIVIDYQKRYPDIIKVNLQEKNMGGRKNFITTFPMCRGEYIALLEGDDYWIDENKLQKQVDFLENNPDCSFCGHSYRVYKECQDKIIEDKLFDNIKFSLEDYLRDAYVKGERKLDMRTLTIMFNKAVLDSPPSIWGQVPYGDYLLIVLCLEKGKGAFLKDVMGVYRINVNSMTQKDPNYFFELKIEARRLVMSYLPKKYKKYIQKDIEKMIKRHEYNSIIDEIRCDSNTSKILEFFEKNRIKNIGIYGVGILGNLLIEKLQNSNVNIKILIDRNSVIYGEDVINPAQINGNINVDAIIVTPTFDFDKIKRFLLSRNVKARIISAKNIISYDSTL